MKPGVFIVKGFVRYEMPVPMGNKVRSNDWTCLLSSGWKRAIKTPGFMQIFTLIMIK